MTLAGMNGTGIAASSTTVVPKASDSSKDPKVIAAYVCFGVGAFIIVVAVLLIIVFLCRRRSKQKKQRMKHRSSLNLDDYKFPGTGNQISTISDSDRRLTKTGAPDYNFTGNGYRFPLATIADNSVLSRRHPLDDETSLPIVLPTFSQNSTDSISPYPSRSSGEISTTESGLGETEGYVRLHRSSPLAGINAIYSSSGELNPDYENTPRKTSSSGSRDGREDSGSRRSSLKRVNMTENARNLGNGQRFIGTVNEGFVSDDYYDAPKGLTRNNSLRTSLDRLKRERAGGARPHSKRKGSVLLENQQMQNGVYHVSLRHDGSSVTQTSVVKHPT